MIFSGEICFFTGADLSAELGVLSVAVAPLSGWTVLLSLPAVVGGVCPLGGMVWDGKGFGALDWGPGPVTFTVAGAGAPAGGGVGAVDDLG